MNSNQIQVGGPNDCPASTTTISSSEHNFSSPMAYGWICPKCGRVYSPSTTMCPYCAGDNKVTMSDKTSFDYYYIYNTDQLTTSHSDPDYNKSIHAYNYNKKEEF